MLPRRVTAEWLSEDSDAIYPPDTDIRGHWGHQFNVVGGEVLDLTAKDNTAVPAGWHRHDAAWFGNDEHLDSLTSCIPRVVKWVESFLAAHRCRRSTPRISAEKSLESAPAAD